MSLWTEDSHKFVFFLVFVLNFFYPNRHSQRDSFFVCGGDYWKLVFHVRIVEGFYKSMNVVVRQIVSLWAITGVKFCILLARLQSWCTQPRNLLVTWQWSTTIMDSSANCSSQIQHKCLPLLSAIRVVLQRWSIYVCHCRSPSLMIPIILSTSS